MEEQIAIGITGVFLPDGTGRVFHPRPNGHQLIANLVLYNIQRKYAADIHRPWPPEVIDHGICPKSYADALTDLLGIILPLMSKPDDVCGVWYSVFYGHFEIYGKNFDAKKFGEDGEGLKQQISGCGDMTKWSYKKLIDDPNGYQWYAEGNLPIGTKACVGRAVVSAGGLDADGCTGAG